MKAMDEMQKVRRIAELTRRVAIKNDAVRSARIMADVSKLEIEIAKLKAGK
jgi:hypothetical protein